MTSRIQKGEGYTLFFLYNYLSVNAELRWKRQLGLRINYDTIDKQSDDSISSEEFKDKILAKRTFCIDIIAQTMMALEDLAAFSLAFKNLLRSYQLTLSVMLTGIFHLIFLICRFKRAVLQFSPILGVIA